MAKAMANELQAAGEPVQLHGFSEDLKAAYRQVPMLPSHVSLCITAQLNPSTKQVEFFELFGNPFGAGHAVPIFCSLGEWLARVLRRLFKLKLEHFFDDFCGVDPPATAASASIVSLRPEALRRRPGPGQEPVAEFLLHGPRCGPRL